MLRDKNLVPLSRQHHHVLALCVRLDRAIRAGEVDVAAWQAEIHQSFEREIQFHFLAEEQELFPVAAQFTELKTLVDELLAEHAALREFFNRAKTEALDVASLADFGQRLSKHIRKEERRLFEGLQQRLSPAQLDKIGSALEQELRSAAEACLLPNEATRLRPAR